jgi:hypothetical protein
MHGRHTIKETMGVMQEDVAWEGIGVAQSLISSETLQSSKLPSGR